MKLVILESPFAPKVQGDFSTPEERDAALKRELDFNLRYARAAMRDCLKNHDEAPSASHLLYTQEGVLDDTIPEERELGINAGLLFRVATEQSVFYVDRGLSGGMIFGAKKAREDGKRLVARRLDPVLLAELGIPTVPVDPKLLAEHGIVFEDSSSGLAA